MTACVVIQQRCQDARYKQRCYREHTGRIVKQEQRKKGEKKKRYYKNEGDAFIIQESDEASDACFFVILPVAVVKKDADSVNKEETAAGKPGKAGLPVLFT